MVPGARMKWVSCVWRLESVIRASPPAPSAPHVAQTASSSIGEQLLSLSLVSFHLPASLHLCLNWQGHLETPSRVIPRIPRLDYEILKKRCRGASP